MRPFELSSNEQFTYLHKIEIDITEKCTSSILGKNIPGESKKQYSSFGVWFVFLGNTLAILISNIP